MIQNDIVILIYLTLVCNKISVLILYIYVIPFQYIVFEYEKYIFVLLDVVLSRCEG